MRLLGYIMDALQFGRWFSERRRRYGWGSQRALVETLHQHPLLREYGISEDFLARLEAGHLAHPFRGSVRWHVLVLSWLLCKTRRDVRTYLRAAELTELSGDETAYLRHLNENLAAKSVSPLLLLPPRLPRFVGRTSLLREVVNILSSEESCVCALTGMPGVGKSALAYEAVHRLVSDESESSHLFSDGVATFSCRGRYSRQDFVALLEEIIDVFSPTMIPLASTSSTRLRPTSMRKSASCSPRTIKKKIENSELAVAIDRVRMALAGKSVLLVLDGLDTYFPLRTVLEALSGLGGCTDGRKNVYGRSRHKVLLTGRYIPPINLMTHHLHIMPLEPEEASDLFEALVGRKLSLEERDNAQQICRALGNLPLALEAAAASVVDGVPTSLLATHSSDSLESFLRRERELQMTLAQALAGFDADMQRQFALLSTLGVHSFSLESAAALRAPQGAAPVPLTQLMQTALDMGQFVRHSLLEIVQNPPALSPLALDTCFLDRNTHYCLHPLLHAYALSLLKNIEPETIHATHRGAQSYVMTYLESNQEGVGELEQVRM